MQPEPTRLTQKSSSSNSSPDPNQPNHHGRHEHDQHALGDLLSGESGGEDHSSAHRPATTAARPAVRGSPVSEPSATRLNSVSPPHSRSPVSRISEHEKASSYLPRKKHNGPSFTVVQRRRIPGPGNCTITDFPNGESRNAFLTSCQRECVRHSRNLLTVVEVLTHILSHLPPASLFDVSLVSRRFHMLVTTPHAWRMAFSRFFPGVEAINASDVMSEAFDTSSENLQSENRAFCRVTALASWRSEYILRTRLLRSLGRGKPAEIRSSSGSGNPRSNSAQTGSAQITYNSNLVTPVSHIHAVFGTALNKRAPSFIHATEEMGSACLSDPRLGKVEQWGFADPQGFSQFVDRYPGDAEYGLGAGDVIGVPNSMDVSQAYGMIYGEGWSGGMIYYRSTEEKRGRALAPPTDIGSVYIGAPALPVLDTICTVWIAKSPNIPNLSEGMVGLLAGSSNGVLSAYSLGTSNAQERRMERGELTARWVLSPGVPIIAIVVDDDFTTQRHARHRIWAVALNALGEAFFLIKFPCRVEALTRAMKLNAQQWETLAWQVGRTVHWEQVEPTRRKARLNPFEDSEVDGSYTPRTSWHGVALSDEQIAAETREIERFARLKPHHFQKSCEGWDMRRRLEVDFAACDDDNTGEGVLVLQCGLEDDTPTSIKRYTRCKTRESSKNVPYYHHSSEHPVETPEPERPSIFGDTGSKNQGQPAWSFADLKRTRRSSAAQSDTSICTNVVEEWLISTLSFGTLKSTQITTAATDRSTFATLTTFEDPLLGMVGSSAATSPTMSPLSRLSPPAAAADVPGQRARLMAVGTKTGLIILWNIRASTPSTSILDNVIKPVRIIHTDSPQISCLALTALYLVHGGNDGLVQAWDPLASNLDPIRTLNSRFSSRARRRLIQAEASPQGVGINLFAAGALCLDPDPTSLRGMVSLGTHLRYWSYSSSAADQYKGNKRRLRRSERGSNQNTDRFSGTGRGALKEYIANEKHELEYEKKKKRKEEERLAGRFGTELLGPGATEDEILAYATLLSQEAAANDELRRKSASSSESGETIIEGSVPRAADNTSIEISEEGDPELREAIKLSLQEHRTSQAGSSGTASFIAQRSSPPSSADESTAEIDDLEFALRLSLAEEKSLEEAPGKRVKEGKGKGRAD